jgi:hypothetical protein
MGFEKILEIVFSGLKREITYVQFHYYFLEQKLPATEPFPRTGFQTTTEEISADDLPRNEQNRLNPIGGDFRPHSGKRNRYFPSEFHPKSYACAGRENRFFTTALDWPGFVTGPFQQIQPRQRHVAGSIIIAASYPAFDRRRPILFSNRPAYEKK